MIQVPFPPLPGGLLSPLRSADVLGAALALAEGGTVNFAGLSVADARAVWRAFYALQERQARQAEPEEAPPPPRSRRWIGWLTRRTDDADRVARDLLTSPEMLSVLALLATAVCAFVGPQAAVSLRRLP